MPWCTMGEIFSIKLVNYNRESKFCGFGILHLDFSFNYNRSHVLACRVLAPIYDLINSLLKKFFVIEALFLLFSGLGGTVGSLFFYFYLQEIEGILLVGIDEIFLKKLS